MDIFAMIQDATLVNTNNEYIGNAVGFAVANGKMTIKIQLFDEYEDDGDDPEREDIPEPIEFTSLKVVGKKD